MDAVAPGLMIAYGVGRIGCQLSGDGDWGVIAAAEPDWWILPHWLWAYDYPHNVINGGDAAVEMIQSCTDRYCTRLAEGHYPTPIYETTATFLIGLLLWSLRKKLTYLPGMLFAIYLITNGIERFFIEYVRVNDQYDFLGLNLTQAQLIAIGFMLAGVTWPHWSGKLNHHPPIRWMLDHQKFDPAAGIYSTVATDLVTGFHAHPASENHPAARPTSLLTPQKNRAVNSSRVNSRQPDPCR